MGTFSKPMENQTMKKRFSWCFAWHRTPAIARWVVPVWSREGDRPFLQNSPGLLPGQGPAPRDPVAYPGSTGLLGSLAETHKGSCYVPVLFQASVSSWSCYSFTFLRGKKSLRKPGVGIEVKLENRAQMKGRNP